MSQAAKCLNLPVSPFPTKVKHSGFRFSPYNVNKCLFYCLFSVTILCVCLHFLLVFLLFKVVPKCRAEVLASVRRGKRAVMCFRGENICVKLTPVTAAICEFNVNDQLYIYGYTYISIYITKKLFIIYKRRCL